MFAETLLEPHDDEVARRFAAGDEQALVWAYERWAGQVHGLAVRAFGSGPDAGGVTPQTFVSGGAGRGRDPPLRGARPASRLGTCPPQNPPTLGRAGGAGPG